ncbi:hypothetical protein NOGI109294_10025 [Nocardiopsis gilva]
MEVLVGALSVVLIALIILFAKLAICSRHAGRHLITLTSRIAQLEAAAERDRVERKLPPPPSSQRPDCKVPRKSTRLRILRGGSAGAGVMAASGWLRDSFTAQSAASVASVALAGGLGGMLYADQPHISDQERDEPTISTILPMPERPITLEATASPRTASDEADEPPADSSTPSDEVDGATSETAVEEVTEQEAEPAEIAGASEDQGVTSPPARQDPSPQDGDRAQQEPPTSQPPADDDVPSPDRPRGPQQRPPNHPGRGPDGTGPPGLTGQGSGASSSSANGVSLPSLAEETAAGALTLCARVDLPAPKPVCR